MLNLPKNLQEKLSVNASTIWRLNNGKIRFPKPELARLIVKEMAGEVKVLDLYPDVAALIDELET